MYGITSNYLYCVSATGNRLNTVLRRDLGSVGQDFTITLKKSDSSFNMGIWLNFDPVNTAGYFFVWDGAASSASVLRYDPSGSGSSSSVLSATLAAATSDTVLRITHDGLGHLELFQGGVSKATGTDASGYGAVTSTWCGPAFDIREGSGVTLFKQFQAVSVALPKSLVFNDRRTRRNSLLRR